MEINNRLFVILGFIGVLTSFNAFKEIQQSTQQVTDNAQKIAEIYNYGFPIVLLYYSQKSNQKKTKQGEINFVQQSSILLSPIEKVKSLSLEEFLTELSLIMKNKKTLTRNKEMLIKMKEVGIKIGEPFSMHNVAPLERVYYRLIPSDVQLRWEKNYYKKPLVQANKGFKMKH
ncbi:hypothetical protein [Flammeovirga aprica]|uniref:Uncharacterized protein n=1 Tax=Flammeovirga aprica JL-4 TaxID=694437 RepID=A0A7X9RVD1_9BACT|nr:hypothetical protein [Flammeovirga aprica]NME69324.1 hypothetical protein [Flammeovirga aprica JL-4]